MNRTGQSWPAGPAMRRSSTKVALVLLGTAGVVGAAAMVDAIRKAREGAGPPPAPQPAPVPITTAQTYANNDFIPGVGYYHAPYHAWYTYPFNYHDPARGYFAGGLWAATPFILNALRSQPSNEAVVAAMAAQRAREEEIRRQAAQSSSNYASSGFRSSSGGGFFSRSPSGSASPTPSTPAHGSTIRGGFGSSAHGSGGAS